MRHTLKLYGHHLRLAVKCQREYRADTVLLSAGIILINVVDLLLLGVLLKTFVQLGGWTVWDVVFLYSMFLVALGVQSFFTRQLMEIETYVQDGTLDQMLIRPVPVLVQILGRELNFKDITHVVLGVAGVVLAAEKLGLPWTPARIAYLVLAVLSGGVVLAGITLALCSLAFWTTHSRVFLSGTHELQEIVQHYPAHIFGTWFLGLITTLLPFAFVNYYPARLLLHHESGLPGWFLVLGPPVAAALVSAVALAVWHTGLGRYQGSGS
ncbi:ABC-2 type transport system permease protein [Amycolatopsis xylanica]|uniref:ABC-2 type transport system permease protein n=1 Tax=Amycolatopsis xylanica TaxID=589385 RepID=A0A1H3SDG5_9PSEU|nr:ABC-2 family transporter protein [Amycolatopsis xylanica]SDZ35710.1 ABC-2 type transport system permease protein [Amycolatopsis xylanica]